MTDAAFLLLFLLIIKHTVCDYFLQTLWHIQNKGVYLAQGGLVHSAHHAVATLLVTYSVTQSWATGLTLALIDFVLHYHIDYVKTRFGPKDPNHPHFWHWFGVDQAAHMLTYLLLVCIM